MTTLALETLTVHTSEAHLLTAARHFGLTVTLAGDCWTASRPLEGVGVLLYMAPIEMELSA